MIYCDMPKGTCLRVYKRYRDDCVWIMLNMVYGVRKNKSYPFYHNIITT